MSSKKNWIIDTTFPQKTQVTAVVRRERLEGLCGGMSRNDQREEVSTVGGAWSHLPSSWNGYGSIQTPQPGYAPLLRASYQPI